MTATMGTTGASQAHASGRQLLQFRVALTEQREFRRDQLDELDASARDGLTIAPEDPRDEVAGALRAAAAIALTEIEAALLRIETGCFGVCEQCDRPIPLERLEILPMAALCMRCQHARDVRARWPHGRRRGTDGWIAT